MSITHERAFEEAIEDWLLTSGGYRKGDRKSFDPAHALDVAELLGFVVQTQPEAWERLVELHGGKADATQKFLARVAAQIDERGTIDVLRRGVEDLGVRFDLAAFRPATRLNPEAEGLYAANRLTVTRQLEYRGDRKDLTSASARRTRFAAQRRFPNSGLPQQLPRPLHYPPFKRLGDWI